MFGEKKFPQLGYPTPTTIPDETTCLTLNIPANDEWWAIVVGVLYTLVLEWNWQQLEGGLDRDEVAARWQLMLEDALDVASSSNSCGITEVEAPFWDTDEDVDDNAPVDEQVWYGEVDDPTILPTTETFRERAEDFAFAGLLAIAGAPGAAISFLTIAPRFRLAFKQGNIGNIIRVFVDANEAAQITDAGDDSIAEVAIIADPELETHQIYITVEGA